MFLVKAEIECDIYSLYYNTRSSKLEKYSTAFIANYKTSVWMNALFRTIKENDNLDYLEESDDEEEDSGGRPEVSIGLPKFSKL